jgi:hypothetical protein
MQQGCHNGNKKMVNKLTISESNSMIEQSLTMENIVVTIDKLVTLFNQHMLLYFLLSIEFLNKIKCIWAQCWHSKKFLSCYERY